MLYYYLFQKEFRGDYLEFGVIATSQSAARAYLRERRFDADSFEVVFSRLAEGMILNF